MMDLFQTEIINIVPYDGEVNYHGKILASEVADEYFNVLLHNIAWRNDEAVIFGKHITTKRKIAWYGDESYSYAYSGTTKHAAPWTEDLLALKTIVEAHCATRFNSCLLNLYHDGSEGMAWHSDDEKSLVRNGAIASLSLGAARHFAFKHKRTQERISLLLESGSLLVMQGTTQTHWLHRLPPTTQVHTPRVNLTFRTMAV